MCHIANLCALLRSLLLALLASVLTVEWVKHEDIRVRMVPQLPSALVQIDIGSLGRHGAAGPAPQIRPRKPGPVAPPPTTSLFRPSLQ